VGESAAIALQLAELVAFLTRRHSEAVVREVRSDETWEQEQNLSSKMNLIAANVEITDKDLQCRWHWITLKYNYDYCKSVFSVSSRSFAASFAKVEIGSRYQNASRHNANLDELQCGSNGARQRMKGLTRRLGPGVTWQWNEDFGIASCAWQIEQCSDRSFDIVAFP